MPDHHHLPEKRRTRRAPPFQLTERDTAIIEAVHHYRMLERRQVEELFFLSTDGQHTNTSYARKRLRRLYLQGYLERILRPIDPSAGSRGPVYRLGPTGARLLAQQVGVPVGQFHYWGRGDDKDSRRTQVQPLFLEHGLALADVRIAIEQASMKNGVGIEVWRDDVELRHARDWDSVTVTSEDRRQERIPINPDGHFILSAANGRGQFFLEMDRSTETIQKTWRRKILGYKQYVLNRHFQQRYGGDRTQTALRILVVTLSVQRTMNLKAAAEKYGQPEASPLFLFAPVGVLVTEDPLTFPIWLRAGYTGVHALL
jgi:hypothetical protein